MGRCVASGVVGNSDAQPYRSFQTGIFDQLREAAQQNAVF
jgi:hypothetical protein